MKRSIVLAATLAALAACSSDDSATTASGGIDRVEPPFWWTGFVHGELQIMLHGEDIAGLGASVDYPGVEVARVEHRDSPNYQFVYLRIGSQAAPGRFEVVLEDEQRSLAFDYELKQRNLSPDHARGFSTRDVIYLVTPDRFVNGKPDNDDIDGYDDKADRAKKYGRHGGDLAGISQSLDYIADMGFTAVWLNPVLENAMPGSSYHGYATTDFYKVDPRFGSNQEYRDLVAAAKQEGLGVIMDMITNHSGSHHWWMKDLPASDWLNFQGDYHQTSSVKTPLLDPYASEYDRRIYTDGWYVRSMPDLNQRNPLLADYLVQNAIWWVEYLGLSGIRLDTYSFSDKHFLSEWSRRIMQEFPDFNITGEETVDDPTHLAYFQAGKRNHDGYDSHTPSQLDFPLYAALKLSLTAEVKPWESPWQYAYSILGFDFEYPDPMNLVVFPDNHDRDRIYRFVDEDYDLYRMAIAYFLTIRGVPQVYYGTEVLMTNDELDNHDQIRGEFPGGWPDHEANAFTGAGLSERQLEAQAFMKNLLNWRKGSDVIHHGCLMQFTPIKDVYVYFRYDDDDTVMVAFNRGHEAASIATDRFAERIEGFARGTDVITGEAYDVSDTLELAPRSVIVLQLEQ